MMALLRTSGSEAPRPGRTPSYAAGARSFCNHLISPKPRKSARDKKFTLLNHGEVPFHRAPVAAGTAARALQQSLSLREEREIRWPRAENAVAALGRAMTRLLNAHDR